LIQKHIDILRLHDTLRDFVPVRTLEIANEESSEVVELGGHIGVLGAVTHVSPGLVDVEHERINESEQTPPTSLHHGVQLIPWLP